MKPSIAFKCLAASFLSRTGILRHRLVRFSSCNVGVLMYHRILSRQMSKRGIQPGMYVNVDTFEKHVQFLKKYFSPISLQKVFLLKEENYATRKRPLCALTFDDGWRDFFENAFPILKAYEVPATVFLPTDFIGSKNQFWTDRFASLLIYAESRPKKYRERNTGNSLSFDILNLHGSLEARIEKGTALLKCYPKREIENILNEITTLLGIGSEPTKRTFVSWDEVREMKSSGFVTFGSHTASHSILTNIERDEVRNELAKSKSKLLEEKVVVPDFIPFCYPNGNYNQSIAQLVDDSGYALAFSTEFGWVGKGDNRFSLSRIPIHNDITFTDDLLLCRILGVI